MSPNFFPNSTTLKIKSDAEAMKPQDTSPSPTEHEGWEKDWEEVNHQLYSQGGVNPHAYRLGWLKTARERDELKREVARLREAIEHLRDVIGDGDFKLAISIIKTPLSSEAPEQKH